MCQMTLGKTLIAHIFHKLWVRYAPDGVNVWRLDEGLIGGEMNGLMNG